MAVAGNWIANSNEKQSSVNPMYFTVWTGAFLRTRFYLRLISLINLHTLSIIFQINQALCRQLTGTIRLTNGCLDNHQSSPDSRCIGVADNTMTDDHIWFVSFTSSASSMKFEQDE